jgi:hypothetical protein
MLRSRPGLVHISRAIKSRFLTDLMWALRVSGVAERGLSDQDRVAFPAVLEFTGQSRTAKVCEGERT